MPYIPSSDPYVSSHVGHGVPSLAPKMDIHMADPLFQGRIQNLRKMEGAVKGAIEYVRETSAAFQKEKQEDIDFQAMQDFAVVDAQEEAGFRKSLQSAKPDDYEKMFNDFSNRRVSHLNQYAGKVSRPAWVKMQSGILQEYASGLPAIKQAEIKNRRKQSVEKLSLAVKGVIDAPAEFT